MVDLARGADTHEVGEGEIVAVYKQDGDRLWRAVFAFARHREIADDAVAEAFAQALRRGSAIDDLHAWIWRAAFRIAAGELKARQRTSHGEAADQLAYLPESTTELILALARLSQKQRAAIILHHYAGYSTKQVAEMIGSTPRAVRVHLFRGRKRLQDLLEVRID